MTALDTGTEDLRAEIDGGVAVITMNRPERRNAFSPAMVSALGAVLVQVETDEAVGCVVLTGAGGAFCAGGDVKSMAASPADRGDGADQSLDARAAACTQIPPPCRPSRHWPYRSFQQPPGSQLDLRFRQQDVRGGIA